MKKGLGKGLDTLFNEDLNEKDLNGIVEVKLSQVEPNSKQPRKSFDADKLTTLADSIKEHGIIQPIIVKEISPNRYSIIAGERRWRAAKLAGLDTIPIVVREYSEQAVMEIALVENLQREDLNPIEEALGYKELCDTYDMTQEQISSKIGKSRSAIANAMRLLSLEEEFQKRLISGEISEGHARAALSLDAFELREFLINQVVKNQLNVRQTEILAKQLQKGIKHRAPKQPNIYEIELIRLQERLSADLGTKVTISNGAKKGKIEIEYYGNDDLDRILNIINK